MILYIVILSILSLIMASYIFGFRKLNHSRKLYAEEGGEPVFPNGGIIVWFAALLYVILHILLKDTPVSYLLYFFVGLTIIAVNSYLKDLKDTPFIFNLALQLLALTFIFWGLYLFLFLSVIQVIVLYIVSAFFMSVYESIGKPNWMTAFYSISVLAPLIYLRLFLFKDFSSLDFLVIPALSCIVLLFFNLTKKPNCMAGNIGSSVLGLWMIYIILKLVLVTRSSLWFLLLSVYMVDFIGTSIHACLVNRNPTKTKGLFFYNVLIDNLKVDPRLVSASYAIFQLFFSLFVIRFYSVLNHWMLTLIVLVPLSLIYLIKFGIIEELKKRKNWN